MAATEAIAARDWTIELRKQVLPRLVRPGPWGLGAFQVEGKVGGWGVSQAPEKPIWEAEGWAGGGEVGRSGEEGWNRI